VADRSEHSPEADSSRRGGDRRGRPWLVAAGFLLALAATVATVLLTGLFVRAPDAGRDDARAAFRAAGEPPAGSARPER